MQISAGDTPTPEHAQRWHRRMSPPDNEFPGDCGLAVMLGRTDDVAVGIVHIAAFSTGFQFKLVVRLREVRPALAGGRLSMLAGSRVRPGVEIPVADRLLLGLEYSDGQRASTLHDPRTMRRDAAVGDRQLVLAQRGGSGTDHGVDQTYWVSPLPPAGPVTFVIAWPAFGIPEAKTAVDGTAIRAAADSCQMLWPPQPPVSHTEPPEPPRPSTGWFAEEP